jgi:hypothetical protein
MFNQDDTVRELSPTVGNPVSTPDAGAGSSAQRRSAFTAALRKAFSFHTFLAGLLIGGVYVGSFTNIHQAIFSASQPLRWLESDTLWHITVGNLILRTHTWPTHDIYSFTAHGSPWIAYEWLGEVIMALAWRAGNMQGLAILMMSTASVIILALFYLAYLGSRNVKSAFVSCAALLPLAAISWTLRPQLLGYLFLIVTLIVLRRFRQGLRKGIWILPLIFLIWTNTHGTFVLGFGVMGIYWLSGLREVQVGGIYNRVWTPRERRQLELVALLCLVASVITPYGTRLAAYPLVMAGSQPVIIKIIQEWQPLALTASYGKLFLFLVLAFGLFVLMRRVRIQLEDLALLLIATGETVIHARFMVLFVPVLAPVLAELITPWFPPYSETKDHPILNFALVALIIAAIVEFFPSNASLQQQLASEMPVGAVHYLDAHSDSSPTFNYFFWGGYLIMNRPASDRVFIDGRLDIYEYSGVLEDYLSIMSLKPDADELLGKYSIRSCLIPPKSALAVLLGASPGWKRVYRDENSVVFMREPVETHPGNSSALTPAEVGTAKRKIPASGA